MGVDHADVEEASDEDLTTYQQKHSFIRYVPPRFRKAWKATVKWSKGPQPPRPWKITPYFEEYQTAHLRVLDALLPQRKQKIWLLIAFYFCWLLVFSLVLWKSAFASDVKGFGKPRNIGCQARFWSRGNECGLNGDLCRPFENSYYTFRCPASCSRVEISEPYVVGNQTVNYQNLVIGGPSMEKDLALNAIYRGDSYICPSAVHSGYISDEHGGCGVVQRIGEQSNFPGSKHHGISSTGFNSYFPLAYSFVKGKATQCKDLRWPLLGVSLTFSILLSLFVTSPAVFFVSIFTGLFAHVALVSDPPGNQAYYSLLSIAFGRFLPAAFCMTVMYWVSVRRTLTGLTAQYEKTILWLGGCWVGALNNYTFDKIPINRLTPHDLKQPGAIPALMIIICSLLGIALGQAWGLRVEGKFPRYLAIYATFIASLLLLVAIPGLNVRIHHYILALLFLPGTCMQNRPSLLYQGLLVGLFINGIGRWGFDSIVQTWTELRGDAPLDSLLPSILPPIIHHNLNNVLLPNITFEWEQPAPDLGYDGISILVNDVERYKGYQDMGLMKSFTWVREHTRVPEYFRFGFMKGSVTQDFTKGGTWDVDGGWIPFATGNTRK
ncbi:hypothetical protein EJ08DRAFT_592840 [Tothia fuscella]|uniref:LCCL domain-containing protein n=1 Tax=Tothia fuscella TaxID=1048955 RepID=A0A9P4NLT6_9PEZI|nr:hypothetical protein EJ08DRAFT_592840 [Tothia fuscella]